ncbi:MAG: DUF192 domain-containing protein [Bradymonadia bacterium]|jgi:uncharacterized membrane protein (UPF0127 family)
MRYALVCFVLLLLSPLSCKHQQAPATDSLRSQIVIDEAQWQRSMGLACSTKRSCYPPLTCNDKRCGIPPSISNKPNAETPSLKFTDSDGVQRSIHVEIAKSSWERELGLMFRKYIHPDWGMLFIFESEDYRSFWMQNTYIPLDMVYIRANGTVTNIIEDAAPLRSELRYPSTDKAKYVLELASGGAKRLGISVKTVFSEFPSL